MKRTNEIGAAGEPTTPTAFKEERATKGASQRGNYSPRPLSVVNRILLRNE